MGPRLTWRRPDLEVGPIEAARRLLGATLASVTPEGTVTVRLTEVEAYAGLDDPGSHAYRGPTRRNAVMFGPAGHAYVYFTYGMHWCLNVVCEVEGTASAVLLRAGEVTKGQELARARRLGSSERDLARGPARLAQAMGVTGEYNGMDLLSRSAPLRLLGRVELPDADVVWGPRVGVSGAGAATPWRAYLRDERSVSSYRPATPRRKRDAAP